jgi:hypothetical protein
MFRQGPNEPSRRMPSIVSRFEAFPGLVAIAVGVPEGFIALAGHEEKDDRPWSIQIRYCDPEDARRRVVVRTTRGSLDWTPVIGTIENVYTVMRNCEAQPVEPAVEEPASAEIDGRPVPAARIQCHDGDCALAFDWRGQHVYVVGVEDLADGLRLRGGDAADFEAYDAAHRARYGPDRLQ